MKVLGIDPGYGRCGVAVLEKNPNKHLLLYSTCIETSAKDTFAERLAQVISICEQTIDEFRPDCIAIEKLFFTNNAKTAMHVAEVRGALINMTSRAGLMLAEYTPAQIKNASTGSGRADKKQITKMLHMLVDIQKEIKHDDEYDAIAVGITHLAMYRAPIR
jgi:crossover junction endodeoxyribonuclease RuvC